MDSLDSDFKEQTDTIESALKMAQQAEDLLTGLLSRYKQSDNIEIVSPASGDPRRQSDYGNTYTENAFWFDDYGIEVNKLINLVENSSITGIDSLPLENKKQSVSPAIARIFDNLEKTSSKLYKIIQRIKYYI